MDHPVVGIGSGTDQALVRPGHFNRLLLRDSKKYVITVFCAKLRSDNLGLNQTFVAI